MNPLSYNEFRHNNKASAKYYPGLYMHNLPRSVIRSNELVKMNLEDERENPGHLKLTSYELHNRFENMIKSKSLVSVLIDSHRFVKRLGFSKVKHKTGQAESKCISVDFSLSGNYLPYKQEAPLKRYKINFKNSWKILLTNFTGASILLSFSGVSLLSTSLVFAGFSFANIFWYKLKDRDYKRKQIDQRGTDFEYDLDFGDGYYGILRRDEILVFDSNYHFILSKSRTVEKTRLNPIYFFSMTDNLLTLFDGESEKLKYIDGDFYSEKLNKKFSKDAIIYHYKCYLPKVELKEDNNEKLFILKTEEINYINPDQIEIIDLSKIEKFPNRDSYFSAFVSSKVGEDKFLISQDDIYLYIIYEEQTYFEDLEPLELYESIYDELYSKRYEEKDLTFQKMLEEKTEQYLSGYQ